jgi:hypothetical protein
VQLPGVALVLWLGPEAGDAAAVAVSIELELEAYGIVDAADEAHARVGLFLHDHSSLCGLHYSIGAGFGQTSQSQAPSDRSRRRGASR